METCGAALFREKLVRKVQLGLLVLLDLMDLLEPKVLLDHQVHRVHVENQDNVVVPEQLGQLVGLVMMGIGVPRDLTETTVSQYVRLYFDLIW